MRKERIGSVVCFVCLSLMLQACSSSNDLTRDKAEKLLLEKVRFPASMTTSMDTIQYGQSNKLGRSWQVLQDKGFIKAKLTRNKDPMTRLKKYITHIVFTDSGKKYVANKSKKYLTNPKFKNRNVRVYVITRYRVFKEITGISMNGDKTTATVEYVVEYELTPFGEAFSKDRSFRTFSRQIAKSKGPEKHFARYKLFDDGWRIVQ